jgi:hypothetical protein
MLRGFADASRNLSSVHEEVNSVAFYSYPRCKGGLVILVHVSMCSCITELELTPYAAGCTQVKGG